VWSCSVGHIPVRSRIYPAEIKLCFRPLLGTNIKLSPFGLSCDEIQISATRNYFKQTLQVRASSELAKVRTEYEINVFCRIDLAFFFFEHVL